LGDAWTRNLEELRRHGSIDLVVFTGDLTASARPEAFAEAADFLLALLGHLRLGAERLFTVPGNHDVLPVTEATPPLDAALVRGLAGPPDDRDGLGCLRERLVERQAPYRAFLAALCRPELSSDGPGPTRYRVRVPELAVEILGLDSAWLSGLGPAAWLGDNQLLPDVPTPGHLQLALVHHPLSRLADGPACRRLLAGAHVLLHGHQHLAEPSTWADPAGRLRVLAAGALYDLDHEDRGLNGCHVLDLTVGDGGAPREATVHFRGWSPTGFWHDDSALYPGGGTVRWFWEGLPLQGLRLRPLGGDTDDQGFRAYLGADRLPYYSRREHRRLLAAPAGVLDEGEMLACLDGRAGLIITGGGGFGKTRLMLELGRRAGRLGWIVLRVTGSFDVELMLSRAGAGTRVLLLIDYIETLAGFADLAERLEEARLDGGGVRYIACCRASHYPAVVRVEGHETVTLAPTGASAPWVQGHREAAVAHILAVAGLPRDAGNRLGVRASPVLAAFASWLKWRGRHEDLRELLDADEFGRWVLKRFQLADAPGEALALLLAQMPLPVEAVPRLAGIQRSLLTRLATDRWVEREADAWTVAHDVLADRVVLSFLELNPPAVDDFAERLLADAGRGDNLGAALTALGRLAGQAGLAQVRWAQILDRQAAAAPGAWESVALELLGGQALPLAERLGFVARHPEIYRRHEGKPSFARAFAAILVQMGADGAEPERTTARQVLERWLARYGAALATRFVYKAWLDTRGDLDVVRDGVAAWIALHATAPTAQFVYKAWLDARGELDVVRSGVVAWLAVHATAPAAQFVYTAWLAAHGDLDLVRGAIVAWLAFHAMAPAAQFVYKAWLDAQGELDLVRGPIVAWLSVHATASEAQFVYKAWLDAHGEIDLVRDAIGAWLALHATAFVAGFVYPPWVDAHGELDLVREGVAAWLAVHATASDAQFVYKAWLNAHGEINLISDAVVAWLALHATASEAQFVYKAWLDAHCGLDLVRDGVVAWLALHATASAAGFVYQAWLDAHGELEVVRDGVVAWLALHASRPEARFVYKAWLDARGELDVVGYGVAAWLALHATDPAAAFVYQGWLNAHGELDLVRDGLVAWFALHATGPEAGFVYPAWLDAHGELDFVRDGVDAWLTLHATAPDAQFVYRAWIEAHGELDLVRNGIVAWVALHATVSEASFVYRAWLEAHGEPDLVRGSVVAWLALHRTGAKAPFVYRAWLDADGGHDLVRGSVDAWLGLHAKTPEARFVYKAWLDACGDLDLVRDALVAWLALHATETDAQFVYSAWLDAQGELDLVRVAVVAWLTVHTTAPEAQFVYKAWLDAHGELDLVRDGVIAWLHLHASAPEARFVLSSWLRRRADRGVVGDALTLWLSHHASHPDSDRVMKEWLQAGGEFSRVAEPAMAWLHAHHAEPSAVYLSKFIARQPVLPLPAVLDVLAWVRVHPDNVDASWRLGQLGAKLALPGAATAAIDSIFATVDAQTRAGSLDAGCAKRLAGCIANVVRSPDLEAPDVREALLARLAALPPDAAPVLELLDHAASREE
jgi:hypothetical protein